VSGFVLKGALVEFMPTFLPIPLPNVTVFQYNPETMVHTWSQPEAAGGAGTTTSNPLAVKGNPGESFSFTLAMDSNEDIAEATPVVSQIAEVSGVYSRLAALEMLLYPTGSTSGGLLGSVSAAAGAAFGGASSGPVRTVPESTMPVVLFIWGAGRIVPVRVTTLTITEKIYDTALNPCTPRRRCRCACSRRPSWSPRRRTKTCSRTSRASPTRTRSRCARRSPWRTSPTPPPRSSG
jgi:hypothetical protein